MNLNSDRSNTTDQIDQQELETRVILLVEALANELNPGRRVQVSLHSSLQRDLGFDSLGLAELLARTEKEFKLRLPEDLIARLETPSDLLKQISETGVTHHGDIARKPSRLPGTAIDAFPDDETTLTGVLDWHVQRHGERPHILLSDGYSETETITYQALSESAVKLAAAMQRWGLEPGDGVGIMLPTEREFFIAFFATIIAGGVAIPMYPPIRLSQLEEHLRRQAGILRNSQAALLLIPNEGKALASLLGGQIETLRGVSTVANLLEHTSTLTPIKRNAEDLVMLQYTSGSTGDPKGVMLTHANLLANIRAMGNAIDVTSKDVFVSWLPLYHDLGLIGAWFGSLYHAVPAVIMSPLRFIVRPESWLWAIHRNSATLTAAPNFAYELCVNKIDDSAIEGLDLSSLRLMANGAESVSPITIAKFTERFKKYGLRAEAMTPVYGLAENSVGVTFSSYKQTPVIDRVSRVELSRTGVATPAGADESDALSFVSSGVPLTDHQIRIVDTLGHEVAERQQGRLEFNGASATRGYFRNAAGSQKLIHDGWLDSSDLAYVANGNVFITGRLKDIIIKGGRNIYPEEVEEAVGGVPEIRKGCVAVFASFDVGSGTEQLIVIAESRRIDTASRLQLEREVADAVFNVLGMPADQIVIASPHAVPKTSSGKIRRSTTRDLYENGKLGQPPRALWLQILRLRLLSVGPRIRRLIKTSVEHIYAIWWWIVLILVGATTWVTVLFLPKRRWRWKAVHALARIALQLMSIPVAVSGKERLGARDNVIVVNHSSYFDAMILASVLPGELTVVAKKELSRQFVAGPFLRKLGALFADRAVVQGGLTEAEAFTDLVRQGAQLVIFPEATFSRMPGMLPFRMGAFSIACAADTPVLPVVITGTRSILRADQWFPRRTDVKVSVLKPMPPGGNDFTAAIQLRDTVRSDMLKQSGETDRSEVNIVFSDIEGDHNTD